MPDAVPLPQPFYDRPVEQVARDLLGKRLVRTAADGTTAGRIVEVEAYLSQGDAACHAYRGRTRRNASMFGPAGCAYVYAIHARWCVNLVTEPEGTPSAVLIRAVEPLAGVELMQARRGTDKRLDLCRGPARLCAAFAIDRALDGHDVTRAGDLWVQDAPNGVADFDVLATTRTGVTNAADLALRFVVAGSPYVSGPRKRRG